MRRNIAVLQHQRDSLPATLLIHYLAKRWEDDGHRVQFVRGTDRDVAADIAILHVDLSVVPDEYLEYAVQFPIVVNGRATDIRKSAFSRNLVEPGGGYDGPVIVKTDLNYQGRPELRAQPFGRTRLRIRRRLGTHPVRHRGRYLVFDRLDDVPRRYRSDRRLVIERYVPERDGETYRFRSYIFFGDRSYCSLRSGTSPIFHFGESTSSEMVEPHPDIVVRRHELGFDYGKFDYVVVDDEAILLDANKTVGHTPNTPELMERIGWLAPGLSSLMAG